MEQTNHLKTKPGGGFKQFRSFVRKEFFHVLRDPKVLLILFGMPVVQVLLFGFVLSNEVKDSKVVVLDQAKDEVSRQLLSRIAASRYFVLETSLQNPSEIEAEFKKGKIKAALVIPSQFQHSLLHDGKASLQIISDATDVNQANTISAYLTAIITQFSTAYIVPGTKPVHILTETKMLYNPQLLGAPNFVPGVMAMVLMLVCVMMTAVSIVKEKETGTMEILLVSPMRPVLVILSKAVPYFILSLVNFLTILLLSATALDLPIKGSFFLLFGISTIFIVTCLVLGILISVRTDSQQTAMFISLIGMLLPTMLLSGFMFPIENMPWPLQVISNVVPSRWYYIIVKSIMIKGAGFGAVWKETLVLCGMTLFLFAVSVKNFKVRLT